MGGLDVDFEQTKVQAGGVKSAEEDAQFGDSVSITFKLPGGSDATHPFKMGHTVEYVKAFLCREHELPMGKLKLTFQEREMIDPLSLVDVRGFEGASQQVAVEVLT
eukprot:CAMPEP_0177766932 /NCGR_PEP_ID=MMETSP0491_2-20121128/8791_1 /TAXON_ID=63592 /ORGANISM="Tetraselmis chuii, Strain PLY429" /LENGTH=105 /DNA_ID=CAMNT_0019283385 /DNA_START=197 /DNA_END=514 /DNA_ORIENTATION=-